jgi:hypothetical protein
LSSNLIPSEQSTPRIVLREERTGLCVLYTRDDLPVVNPHVNSNPAVAFVTLDPGTSSEGHPYMWLSLVVRHMGNLKWRASIFRVFNAACERLVSLAAATAA